MDDGRYDIFAVIDPDDSFVIVDKPGTHRFYLMLHADIILLIYPRVPDFPPFLIEKIIDPALDPIQLPPPTRRQFASLHGEPPDSIVAFKERFGKQLLVRAFHPAYTDGV
jgi:hypothetical protein